MALTLVEAMAKFEGFGSDPNNRPTRNNNPGNVSWGSFARANGATRIEEIPKGFTSTPRYAYFPDSDTGFAAMKALLRNNYKGLTIQQTIYRWAPPSENDSAAYVKFVCQQVGRTSDTVIDELI